jgi:hypothetical protein
VFHIAIDVGHTVAYVWFRVAKGGGMPRVEESIVLERPAEEVFAFVTTPENDHLWSSTAVERSRDSEEPLGVGSRIRAIDKFLGRRIESTLVDTDPWPIRRDRQLRPRPGGRANPLPVDPGG